MESTDTHTDAAEAEPPKPARGLTAEERGRDVSAAQAQAEDHRSNTRRALALMSPKVYFSQAAGYPLPIKWFLWFAMVFVYPVWLIAIPIGILFGWILYGALLVLFLPLRLWMMWKRPQKYAEWKEQQRQKKQRA